MITIFETRYIACNKSRVKNYIYYGFIGYEKIAITQSLYFSANAKKNLSFFKSHPPLESRARFITPHTELTLPSWSRNSFFLGRPSLSSNAFPALNHRAIKRIIIHPRRDTRIRDNDLRKDFLLFFLFHVDVDQKVTTHVQIIPNDRWFSCNPASFALRNSADNNLIVVSIIFESLGRRASRFNGFISMIWTH